MLTILAFFILICILVAVHEWGHFIAARVCGVKVLRFSVGFGKVLWRWRDKHETEFVFSLIPLGGYVQMYDTDMENTLASDKKQALSEQSILKRAFILSAGPMANFLFALFSYWIVFMNGIPNVRPVISNVSEHSIAAQAQLPMQFEFKDIMGQSVHSWEEVTLVLMGYIGTAKVEVKGNILGEDYLRTYYLDLSHWQVDDQHAQPLLNLGIIPEQPLVTSTIKAVTVGSEADKKGLVAGDKIITVNGQAFNWEDLLTLVKNGKILTLEIERHSTVLTLNLEPKWSEKELRYLIGIVPHIEALDDKYRSELKYDMLDAFFESIKKVASLTQTICQFIGHLLSGELSISNMGGPVAIAKGAGMMAEIGWVYYVSFMALISVNLGVMNLLPILPLDGGQLTLLSVEYFKGKAVARKMQRWLQKIGIILISLLMFFVLLNDITHL